MEYMATVLGLRKADSGGGVDSSGLDDGSESNICGSSACVSDLENGCRVFFETAMGFR